MTKSNLKKSLFGFMVPYRKRVHKDGEGIRATGQRRKLRGHIYMQKAESESRKVGKAINSSKPSQSDDVFPPARLHLLKDA